MLLILGADEWDDDSRIIKLLKRYGIPYLAIKKEELTKQPRLQPLFAGIRLVMVNNVSLTNEEADVINANLSANTQLIAFGGYWQKSSLKTTVSSWTGTGEWKTATEGSPKQGVYRVSKLTNTYHILADDKEVLEQIYTHGNEALKAAVLQGARADADQFATFGSWSAATNDIADKISQLRVKATRDRAQAQLTAANTYYTNAITAIENQNSDKLLALQQLVNARTALATAYADINLAQKAEQHAFWESTGVGINGNWQQTVADAKSHGFTHVVARMARGSTVTYPSEKLNEVGLPGAQSVTREWDHTKLADPLQTAIQEAHSAGLKFIAWKTNFSTSTPVDPALRQIVYVPPLTVSGLGSYRSLERATSPCNDDVRNLDFAIIQEIATKYNVDGIQLDYIRFNSSYSSYDKHCRAAFIQALGNETGVCFESNELMLSPGEAGYMNWAARAELDDVNACRLKFTSFRKDLLTQHVARIRAEINLINQKAIPGKPKIELSAAVFPAPGSEDVFQDWPNWVKDNRLDSLYSMTYAPTVAEFEANVAATEATLAADSASPSFPVFYSLLAYDAPADVLIAQMSKLRTRGVDKIAMFAYGDDTVKSLMPQMANALKFVDADADGVQDDLDNCRVIANANQADFDGNGTGDACEPCFTAINAAHVSNGRASCSPNPIGCTAKGSLTPLGVTTASTSLRRASSVYWNKVSSCVN